MRLLVVHKESGVAGIVTVTSVTTDKGETLDLAEWDVDVQ